MAPLQIEIVGLKELSAKISKMTPEIREAMKKTMDNSLLVLWENVPPYPPKPPESKYRRTMTLGGSLGSSQSGGRSGGKPTIYSVKGSGANVEGRFGTNLNYAKYVIDPQQQAYMHRPGYKGRKGWWTMADIRNKSENKIQRFWNTTIELVKRKLGL
jgi:hypothetical protein